MPERAILVYSRRLHRSSIAGCLRSGGYEILGEAGSHSEAFQHLTVERPNLLLLGPALPEVEQFKLCRNITERWPKVRVVMFHEGAMDQRVQSDAAAVGASACLVEADDCDQILAALDILAREFPPYSRSQLFLDSRAEQLTPRELDVVRHLAAGLSSREIAAMLDIRTNTVRNHVQNSIAKLGVNTRQEAVRRARRLGWIPSELDMTKSDRSKDI